MSQKFALIVALLLNLSAIGFGIFAHAIYTADGSVTEPALAYGGAAIAAFALGWTILIRMKRKIRAGDAAPIDLSNSVTYSIGNMKLGIGLMGFGAIALLFVAPMVYALLSSEKAIPGRSDLLATFPIEALRPGLQWLHAAGGALGVVGPIVLIGLLLSLMGWRMVRR